ncbi:MAG: hypothetical protein NVSMB51_09990 [Solirubrobacteraceae bacterium]
MPTPLRLLLALTLAALLGAAGPALGAARSHQRIHRAHPSTQGCGDVNAVPGPGNLAAISASLLCLINQQRAADGLPPLRTDARLAAAARRQTMQMLAGHFFDHTSPAGLTMQRRIIDAGYVRASGSWTLGENLIWASGALATPAALVRGWMRSPEHRANIVGSYRETGLGVSLGTPDGGVAGGLTVTEDFGSRG